MLNQTQTMLRLVLCTKVLFFFYFVSLLALNEFSTLNSTSVCELSHDKHVFESVFIFSSKFILFYLLEQISFENFVFAIDYSRFFMSLILSTCNECSHIFILPFNEQRQR